MGRKKAVEGKLSIAERVQRADVLIKNDVPKYKALRLANIWPAQYALFKKKAAEGQFVAETVAQFTEAPAAEQKPQTLVGRLLKSNMTADDKIALLQAAYN